MRLYFPLLPKPLLFEENRVNVLIIEDPFTLRRSLAELSEQIDGASGDFVLSVNDEPLELSNLAAILLDPLHPNTDSKKLTGKITKEAAEAALGYEAELTAALSSANTLASRISREMRFPVAFDPLEDPSDLMRLFGFRLDSDSLDAPELLLEWMLMQRELLGKRLFILYGMKSFLRADELVSFYRNALYEKLDLLLIEPFQREAALKEECVTIIDKDLCVIF